MKLKLRKIERFYISLIIIFLIISLLFVYLPSLRSQMQRDSVKVFDGLSLLEFLKNSLNTKMYSKWPKFIDLKQYSSEWVNVYDNKTDYFNKLKCLKKDSKLDLKISNLVQINNTWSLSDDIECIDLFKKLMLIYEIKIQSSSVNVPYSFESKVKTWLGNDSKLFAQVKNQVLIISMY